MKRFRSIAPALSTRIAASTAAMTLSTRMVASAATTALSTRMASATAALALCATLACLACAPAAFAATAPGGTVGTSGPDGEGTAQTALGADNIQVASTEDSLTITLVDDVQLQAPLELNMTNLYDSVTINLSGHTLTGAPGIVGASTSEEITGQPTISIVGTINLDVAGPGTVIGGAGVIGTASAKITQLGTDSYHDVTQAGNGGEGILIKQDSGAHYQALSSDDTIRNFITIRDGATVSGGPSASVSLEDTYTNPYTGETAHGVYYNDARGGMGITDMRLATYNADNWCCSRWVDETYYPSYYGINVQAGSTVKGGDGANLNLASEEAPNSDGTGLRAAMGGYGMFFLKGRLQINVDEGATVAGGNGGSVQLSSTCLTIGRGGNGGYAIDCWADLGLTNEAGASDGLCVAGTVRGGNGGSVTGRIFSRGETYGGDGGTALNLPYTLEYSGKRDYMLHTDFKSYGSDAWGLANVSDTQLNRVNITATGMVAGGDGGSVLWGRAGNGGYGLSGVGSHVDDLALEGNLTGGNGGDSRCGAYGYSDNACPLGANDEGFPGNGGFCWNASSLAVSGSGTASVGQGGTSWYALGATSSESGAGDYDYEWWSYAVQIQANAAESIHINIPDNVNGTYQAVSSEGNVRVAFDGTDKLPAVGDTITADLSGEIADALANGETVYYDWRVQKAGVEYRDGNHVLYLPLKVSGDGSSYTFTAEDVAEIDEIMNGNAFTKTWEVWVYAMTESGRCVKSERLIFPLANSGSGGTDPSNPGTGDGGDNPNPGTGGGTDPSTPGTGDSDTSTTRTEETSTTYVSKSGHVATYQVKSSYEVRDGSGRLIESGSETSYEYHVDLPTASASKAYTGKTVKPTLSTCSAYAASGSTSGKAVGAYKVTFKLTGGSNYKWADGTTGAKTKTWTIVPAKPSLYTPASASAGTLTVKAAKTPAGYGGKYYQVAYKQVGASKWVTKKYSTQSVKLTKLKKGKQYYVKVRAYKTVSGKTYTGAWSATKKSGKVK